MLRPLRHARLWFAIGIVILAVAIYLNLAPQVPGPEFPNSDKLEHLLGWAGLTVWFGSVVQRRLFGGLALAMLALGGTIELLQAWMALGRQGDWHDVGANALGVSLGLLLAAARRDSWLSLVEKWLPAT